MPVVTRITNTKRANEKLTPDEVRALVRALLIEGMAPAVVSVRWALGGAILAIVLSAVAVVIAVAK